MLCYVTPLLLRLICTGDISKPLVHRLKSGRKRVDKMHGEASRGSNGSTEQGGATLLTVNVRTTVCARMM